MVMVYPRLILLLAGVALVLLILVLHFDPACPSARLVRHSVAGLFALLLWNALPLPQLGVNPLSAWVAGALGLPGMGLLAVLAQLP
ncbi:MAG: pro-sigmaK processing inhibitor BofA family protein [Clostridia bacterium]|nr:pro-sigmaK processing inhibitor BofA family protein [Clostridia bacterium]